MQYEIIKKSKKKFDILQDAEMNRLSLRKQRLIDYFNSKRKEEEKIQIENIEANSIHPNTLKVNEATRAFSVKDIESKADIVKLKAMLVSLDINIRNYAIYLLRTYFVAHSPTNITLMKELNLIHLLTEILSSDASVDVQTEIYWIFLNFSFCEGKEQKLNNYLDIFSSESYIKIYTKSILLMNFELNQTITHFILNISFHSIKCRHALLHNDIMPILLSLLENKHHYIDCNCNLILLLGVLVKNQINISEFYMNTIYDILISLLLKTNPSPDMTFCCLFGLVNLSDYINTSWPIFSQKATEDGLIDFILNHDYNNIDNDNDKISLSLIHSIQLLANLLLSEDISMSEYLLSKNILDFLLNILQSNQSPMIIKEILLTLKSISVGLVDEITQLVSHSIFNHCTTVFISHPNHRIQKEVLNIISNCLHYKLNDISKKVYSNGLIEDLIRILDQSMNQDLILNSLKIILQFLLSDNKETNCFLRSLQELTIEDLIEKHLLSPNKDINIISNAIIKRITLV